MGFENHGVGAWFLPSRSEKIESIKAFCRGHVFAQWWFNPIIIIKACEVAMEGWLQECAHVTNHYDHDVVAASRTLGATEMARALQTLPRPVSLSLRFNLGLLVWWWSSVHESGRY
jgi:hypothetical protein